MALGNVESTREVPPTPREPFARILDVSDLSTGTCLSKVSRKDDQREV